MLNEDARACNSFTKFTIDKAKENMVSENIKVAEIGTPEFDKL